MHRREFFGFAGSGILASLSSVSYARDDFAAFDRTFAAYLSDRSALLDARQFRDLGLRDMALTESQSGMSGYQSSLQISRRARRLIIDSEVSSKAYYKSALTNPIWPGGKSGITIGIGYDLGYVTEKAFRSNWKGILTEMQFSALRTACRKKGPDAKAAKHNYRGVAIGWESALAQFDHFLPFVIGETEKHFANCTLLSKDSLGALVSLVYNRGSDTNSHSRRRREMHQIKLFMESEQFAMIPEQIRSMKRLWIDDPHARGLLKRRDLEALLFEEGLH